MHRRLYALAVILSLLGVACGKLEPLSDEQALERLNVATTKVYASDGSLIANLHGEINRDRITLEDIPEDVRNAVIAIEDERYWTHAGIDVKSIARAALSNARSQADGSGSIQGGSTISQQLVKNLYFEKPERTIKRKVLEAQKTWQLEQDHSKREILERYLNTVYFGRGVYGIQTAARSYFHKDAAELTLPEAAFLAGLIRQPGRYDYPDGDFPRTVEGRRQIAAEDCSGGTWDPCVALARRNTVLTKMHENGFITDEQDAEARSAPLELYPRELSRWEHPYFVDMILTKLGVLRCKEETLDRRFDDVLGDDCSQRQQRVYRGGLRIHTSLDPQVQEAAEEAVDEVMPPDLDRLSASIAAIEPQTGFVRAVVGGRDYYPEDCDGENADSYGCRFGRVNLAMGRDGGGLGRQPGSSFKPVVLAAALERGVSLYSGFGTTPFTHRFPGGTWTVRNYEGSGGGHANLVEATVRSVNAAYAHLLIDGVGEGDALRGAARVADLSRRMGIAFEPKADVQERCGDDYGAYGSCTAADDVPSIALGAKEVSPMEMASAYATFANEGVRVEPTSIVRITDGSGRTLYEADPGRDRVVPRGVALAATSVLEKVVQRGTATRAQIDRPAAAKTGTAQQWRDAWLVGYVPQLAAAVWVGNPEKQEEMLPSNGYPFRVTGGSLPAMVWQYFMTKALSGVPIERFAPPPSSFFVSESTPAPAVEVPDVLGMSLEAARSALDLAGFGAADSPCLAPLAPSEGIVVKQTPAGGTEAPAGSTVSICISVTELPEPGSTPDVEPAPGPGGDGEQTASRRSTVPSVLGESRARASSTLRDAGFEMADVRECDPTGSSEAGRIWKQSPSGGTQARHGSTVTVWYNPAGCG